MSCGRHHPDRSWAAYDDKRVERQRNHQMWAAAWVGAVEGAVSGARGAPAVPARVRVGDTERESAVTALGEHYAAGRLTKEEFDERAEVAWTARTSGDLTPLFADLPRLTPPVARQPRRAPSAWRLHVGLWWVFVLLLGLALAGAVSWLVVPVFASLWCAGVFSAVHRWAHTRR